MDITLSDKSKLKHLDLSSKLLLDSIVLIYGARNSGKTTAVMDIMYHLKDEVNKVFIISQSAGANNQFEGYVPSNCVKTNLSPEWILRLVEAQKKKAGEYRSHVMNDEMLVNLFNKCASENERLLFQNIIGLAKDKLELAEQELGHDIEKLQIHQEKIKRNRNKYKRELLKQVISNNLKLLERRNDLTTAERTTINLFHVNPHIMLVFDDCASAMKEWTKKYPSILETIYNGRHFFVTVIITAQSDTSIDNKVRMNATVSFYTDPNTAAMNISREHQNDKQRGIQCIKVIWRDMGKTITYKKLAYLAAPDDHDPFRYIVFRLHDKFRVGSPAFWKNCQRLDSEVKVT